jgi:hypothetical protein
MKTNGQLIKIMNAQRNLTIHALARKCRIPWRTIGAGVTISIVLVVCIAGHFLSVATVGAGLAIAVKGIVAGHASTGATGMLSFCAGVQTAVDLFWKSASYVKLVSDSMELCKSIPSVLSTVTFKSIMDLSGNVIEIIDDASNL